LWFIRHNQISEAATIEIFSLEVSATKIKCSKISGSLFCRFVWNLREKILQEALQTSNYNYRSHTTCNWTSLRQTRYTNWLLLKTKTRVKYTITYIRGIQMTHNIHVSMYILISHECWMVYYTNHDNMATKHYVKYKVCKEHWNYWQIYDTNHMYKYLTAYLTYNITQLRIPPNV
jgi:hypothetical protein